MNQASWLLYTYTKGCTDMQGYQSELLRLQPYICQWAMDSISQGMSHVICYIDDILITGTTVSVHDNNLEKVL